MNVKIALLTLLVIVATATMITITAMYASDMPSITSIGINSEENLSSGTTSSDLVQPLGDAIGGGWPLVTSSSIII